MSINTLKQYFGACFICLSMTCLGLSRVSVANAQEGDLNITGVSISGTKRIDAETLKASLGAQTGSVSKATIRRDIRTLYKTGFFDQVEAELHPSAGGEKLTYAVSEKPVVRKIYVKGNEDLSEDDLKEVLNFKDKRFVDKATIETVVRKAQAYYQAQGYYDVKFQHSVTAAGEGEVDITFEVDEGKRYKILEVKFRGAKEADPEEMTDAIQTKRYKWYSSWLMGTGRLNKEMLANDSVIIRQYLLDHGFVEGVVREPIVEKVDEGLVIIFELEEGSKFSIGKVSLKGDQVEKSSKATLEGVKTKKGETFSASALREDALKISDNFGDRGYAFANVVPNTNINRAARTVDIEFAADQGELVHVDKILIKGNNKTYDNVIRREMQVQEQQQYSTTKIRRSKVLLERLGYFEEVNVGTEPGDQPDEVDLVVNVREGSTGAFSVGAGYSSSDGAIFNTRLSENNFLGTGRQLVANADIGTERENLVLSLNDRRLNDSYWSGGTSLMHTTREFDDFDRMMEGGNVSVGYPLDRVFGTWAEDIDFGLKYEYVDIDISDVDPENAAPLVIESEGKSSAGGLTPSITRNTINNPLNPTHGSMQQVSVEATGLGGNQDFYLIEARQQVYHPLIQGGWGDIVGSWRTTVGYGESYDDEPFPLFSRFFPGGINSVRGYEARSLGPKDEDGNEYGGSKELINNLELIFPIVNSAGLKGVVFYDMGQAFDDDKSIDIGELRKAWGYGIRWISPLGPIRLEFGFPIDREEGEDSMITNFSFGAPF